MTEFPDSLRDVAERYDAIVLDQWGVLHDGARPYPEAVEAIRALRAAGTRLAVLSNSGKRAAPNAARITSMGFAADAFEVVMSSGEALWRDIADGTVPERRFHPIERAPGDAAAWAAGLEIMLTPTLDDAEAIALMGLPDEADTKAYASLFAEALELGLPVYCSNPDRTSPRGDGYVISPGVLAHDHADAGGTVHFYGKPHRPIFESLSAALGSTRLLMVGDSIEHDIAGAAGAGWDSLLIRGGIHAPEFAEPARATSAVLADLAQAHGVIPTYTLEQLR